MKMRLGLRYRLLVPAVLLLPGTVAATAWAANHAAGTVDRQIDERIRAIEQTVNGPPTFRLNEPILRQMRGLTGAFSPALIISSESFAARSERLPSGSPRVKRSAASG